MYCDFVRGLIEISMAVSESSESELISLNLHDDILVIYEFSEDILKLFIYLISRFMAQTIFHIKC